MLAAVSISIKTLSLILLNQALQWRFSETTVASLILYTKLASESIRISLSADIFIKINISFEQAFSISIKRYLSSVLILIEAPESIINQTSILINLSSSL